MNRIVILGGGGVMARVTARDIVERTPDATVLLADVRSEAADDAAAWLRRVVPGAAARVDAAAV
ncbi:MAG: hypothetical protein M3295_05790, partial [Chloroflexota bacterium]|nr:hypothetical protein [Chloroflexota bacterium]